MYITERVSAEPRDGWLPCELEILAVEEVQWPTEVVGSLRLEDGGWPRQPEAYECTVRLITGRTHQVSKVRGYEMLALVGSEPFKNV